MAGKGKSGWKGESRRHSLSRKGIKTNIDKDRRLDVSKFVAKGKKHEFADDLPLWTNAQINEFEEEFGNIEKVEEQGGGEYWIDTDIGSYRVFERYELAVTEAERQVLEDLEDDSSLFNQDWLLSNLEWGNVRDTMEEIYDEWNVGYIDDIETESDTKHDNRLISEMVDAEIISDEEARDPNFIEKNIDTLKEKMRDNMTNDQLNEGREGLDHYEMNFGKDELAILIKNKGLIDFGEASEDAVSIDGVAHFLAGYDGDEHLLGDSVIYRTN